MAVAIEITVAAVVATIETATAVILFSGTYCLRACAVTKTVAASNKLINLSGLRLWQICRSLFLYMNIVHFLCKFDDINVFCLQKARIGGIILKF